MIEDRFSLIERGQVGSLKEFSDRDFIAPDESAFHCLVPIGGIIGRVLFEFSDSLPEPGVGVVMVVSHTRTEDINEGKPLVLESLLYQFRKVFGFSAEAARASRWNRAFEAGVGVPPDAGVGVSPLR